MRWKARCRSWERCAALVAALATAPVGAAEPPSSSTGPAIALRAPRSAPASTVVGPASLAEAPSDRGCALRPRDASPRPARGTRGRQAKELVIAGGTFTGLGVVGLAIGIAGATIGAMKQREADGKMLPAEQRELERLDREGARANQMSIGGFAAGAGLLLVGSTLLAVGLVARKRARADRHVQLQLAPSASGLRLQGRF